MNTNKQTKENADSSDSTFHPHRRRSVVETAGCELVGFRDKSIPEATIVVGRDLPADPGGLVNGNQVGGRLRINGQLSFGASNFSTCHN